MAESVSSRLGTILKRRRESLGRTQAEVADDVLTTQPNISKWEGGDSQIPIDALPDIAKAYKLYNLGEILSTVAELDTRRVAVAIDTTKRYKKLYHDYRLRRMDEEAAMAKMVFEAGKRNPDVPGRIVNVMQLTPVEYGAAETLRLLINPDLPLDAYVELLAETVPRMDDGEEVADDLLEADMHDLVCRFCPLDWCSGVRGEASGCHWEARGSLLGGQNELNVFKAAIRAYADEKASMPDVFGSDPFYTPQAESVLDWLPKEVRDYLRQTMSEDALTTDEESYMLEDDDEDDIDLGDEFAEGVRDIMDETPEIDYLEACGRMLEDSGFERRPYHNPSPSVRESDYWETPYDECGWSVLVYDQDGTPVSAEWRDIYESYEHDEEDVPFDLQPLAYEDELVQLVRDGRTVMLRCESKAEFEAGIRDEQPVEGRYAVRFCTREGAVLQTLYSYSPDQVVRCSNYRDGTTDYSLCYGDDIEIWNGRIEVSQAWASANIAETNG